MKRRSRLHEPVLLQETMEALAINPSGIYMDGTFGRGGHSEALLSRLNEKGRLICLDKDPDAIAYGQAHWAEDKRVSFFHSCFSHALAIAQTLDIQNRINGILLDLGVSSAQLDTQERGFSFMREGPLDMRMDPTKGVAVKEWLNAAPEKEIRRILKKYGEETRASQIARFICEERQRAPIVTTQALASLILTHFPLHGRGKHPATKTFQAFRLFINQELEALDHFLDDVKELLAPRGRVAIISFHSLEDRKVKRFFRAQSKVEVPKGLAVYEEELIPPFRWVVKRQMPSLNEVEQNWRSRSARLRVGEKMPVASKRLT